MADINDWGAKVSLKGYPVQTCADHQCLFHSSWITLKIEAQGSYTTTGLGNEIIYNHNLGYPPAFLSYTINPLYLNNKGSYLGSGSGLITVGVDNDNLVVIDDYFEVAPAGIEIYYYIFRYDLTTDFESQQLTGVSLTPESIDDYGLKISKEGKSIDSTDYRDFIIHSSCKSLQIHKSGFLQFIGDDGDPVQTITILHGLDYAPMFWGFYRWTAYALYPDRLPFRGYWIPWDIFRQAAENVAGNADSTNLYIYPIGYTGWSYDISYMIFKDPYELLGE